MTPRILTRMRHARACLLALFCALALLATPPEARARDPLSVRYLRAAHLLRTLHPGDHWPPLAVPRRIKTADATSALAVHPDKNFVLATIARDLTAAEASGKYPEAGYYAAHALALREEHAGAAASMRAYLATAPFRERDYLFLVRELYAAQEYAGVREAARRWQTVAGGDNACSEDRLAYVWGSFHAVARHREAMEAVLFDPCASWRGQVLFARSSLALGDEEGAEARIASAVESFPENSRDIYLLWNRLTAAERFP